MIGYLMREVARWRRDRLASDVEFSRSELARCEAHAQKLRRWLAEAEPRLGALEAKVASHESPSALINHSLER